MKFKINNINFAKNIIVGTYEVNANPRFQPWTDANLVNRKTIMRQSVVSGSFDMMFKSMEDFAEFQNAIDSVKTNEDYIPNVEITINGSNEDKIINCYLDFILVRDKTGSFTDCYQKFKVTIEER